jgi:hypothetical protein
MNQVLGLGLVGAIGGTKPGAVTENEAEDGSGHEAGPLVFAGFRSGQGGRS